MQTQRVYMRDRRSLLPVVLGPEREVMLDWEFNQKYQTRIQAFLAPTKATKAHIIELQPIAALPVQPPQLVLTPDAANTDTTLVAQLCPIANLDLAQVLQLRAQEFGYLERTATGFTYDPANINVTLLQQCAPFPVVTATEVTPIPMIHVSRVTFSDKRSFEILELEFDYDGFIVSAFSTANALCIRKLNVNATTEKVHYVKRLKDFEASFKKPLAEKMQIAHQELFQLSQELRHIKAFWFGERTSARYKSQWIELLSKHLPELEQLGAQLHIDKDIQFDFVEVDESTWYLELEPTEGHWFEMSLGFQVGDESINLMQVLLGQINQLPSQAELAELDPDEQIPVEIETGRFAFLKAGRLLQILSAFYELLESKSKPRMASYHAALVHKFADSFQDQPVQWRGSQQMRQLGEQLSQNGEIPPVAPAPSLNAVLREYQGYGLSWLQFLSVNCLNGILADDMGLGKTLQTLAHLQLHILERRSQTDPVALGPSLVVTPTSVVSNWSREASIFTPELEVVEYYGLHRHKIDIHAYDIVVTSYGIVRQDLDLFREANLYFIVLDEAQAIKNPTSKTAIAIKTIPSQHRLCLTGTPIENHLGELWSMFDFLMPGFLSSVRRFNKLYRKPIEDQGDKLQAKQLQQRIAPFILRRTKDVVAKDLPPKTEMIHSCTLTDQQRDLYETVRLSVSHSVQNAISQRGLAQSQIVILDGILKLRQICCHPQLLNLAQAQQLNQSAKLEELLELLEPLVEEGRSVLVFSSFASMLDLIAKRLEKHKLSYLMLTGKTRNRQDLVDRFQAGESPIFLISLKAGGTGLTLTQADTVIHYDPWWNPAVEDQATDRAYRIGQDKPVFVYKLITQGTIEQKMLALKERKQAIANSVYNPSDEQSTRLHFSLEDIENLFAPI